MSTPVLSPPPQRSPLLSEKDPTKLSWPWLRWFIELVTAVNQPIASFPGLTGDVVAAPGSIDTTVEKIQGIPVEAGTPGDGQVLEYNLALNEWIFASLSGITGLNVVSKNANYAASPGDVVLCNTSGAGFMVTLPNAATAKNKTIVVKKVSGDGNNVTVVSTNLIDGGGAAVFSIPFTALSFISDGANWWIT